MSVMEVSDTSASSVPRVAPQKPSSSASADWLRGLKRTSGIKPNSTRTLARVIDDVAAQQPDQIALTGDHSSLTYGELQRLSHRVARWALARGLKRQDCVGLLMGNCPEYVAIWIGLSRLGIVTALFNTKIQGESLRHCVEVAKPDYIISDSDGLSRLHGHENKRIFLA